MHALAERVQHALRSLGYPGSVRELQASTRTALEAAQAVRCDVGQIVKSLVFSLQRAGQPDELILILVSGTNRVHEKHLGRHLGGTLARADAEAVHAVTGYAIGGVPPVGHTSPLLTLMDEDLLQYPVVWAAAGTANAVFEISPQTLVQISGAVVVDVK